MSIMPPEHLVNKEKVKSRPVIRRQRVSDEDRKRIVEKRLDGKSVFDIHTMLDIKYQTVNTIVKRFEKTGLVLPSKRGGDRRSKLPLDIKTLLLRRVDEECTLTLPNLKSWLAKEHNVDVSTSTIGRTLKQFHYTLKRVTHVPERRYCPEAVETRKAYACEFGNLEVNNNDKNLIFIDEVGFSVSTRPKRGRSRRGHSAYLSVPAARSRNISVVAAMNKYGMIFHKIHEKAVNGEDFKEALKEMHDACLSIGVESPVFIMDNARIHHYKGLDADPEVSQMVKVFLPPYSPFLNPIENVFSVWKNLVIRSNAENERHLRSLIRSKFNEITRDQCEAFYGKMKRCVERLRNGEINLD